MLTPVSNLAPRGELHPLKVKLVPRGEVRSSALYSNNRDGVNVTKILPEASF
jgi:hypothetical protein